MNCNGNLDVPCQESEKQAHSFSNTNNKLGLFFVLITFFTVIDVIDFHEQEQLFVTFHDLN